MQLINTISTSRTWTRHGLKIAYGVSGLLLVAVMASVALSIKTQNEIKAANYAEQAIAPIRKKAQHSYRVNDIINANLFGNPSPVQVAKVAPKTTLDLTLQGVLAASDKSIARAIIMSGKRNSNLYSIGESIQGAGVSIEAIKANEVLLNRNGAIESLPMIKPKSRGGGDDSIISYSDGRSGEVSSASGLQNASQLSHSRSKPRSANGQPRKIKKPNFSGLDRALQKMGEI
ncbi:MAG: type II secretory pathway component PulC [Arenicella sp.]|jgi:type II secretory pathway component PulC